MRPATIALSSGILGFGGLITSGKVLKSYMERPLREGIYPDIDLGSQKVSIQLSMKRGERF